MGGAGEAWKRKTPLSGEGERGMGCVSLREVGTGCDTLRDRTFAPLE
jgi:hypothetical protein